MDMDMYRSLICKVSTWLFVRGGGGGLIGNDF